VDVAAQPPEGTHPDAGAAAMSNLPVPKGATREMVALGDRVFHGQVGGAACTGCHGDNGEGTPLAPALTGKNKEWLWSDGSYAGIAKTITEGVSHPKNIEAQCHRWVAHSLRPIRYQRLQRMCGASAINELP